MIFKYMNGYEYQEIGCIYLDDLEFWDFFVFLLMKVKMLGMRISYKKYFL